MLEAPAVLTPVVTPGGDWGHVARKTKPEGERKNARRAASNFTLAQAGVPIKRDGKCSPPGASPNECRECGWEVPVYGLCGSSYFPDPPHLLCLWGSNLPQLFSLAATSHAAWEGGMGSTFDHTFSWGTEGSEGGGHSKANYWAENLC